MKRILTGFGIVISLLASGNGIAASHKIEMKDKVFKKGGKELKTLKVELGDEMEFVNKDNVLHMVFAPPLGINQMHQIKGKATKVKAEKEGEYDITCPIHPTMKFKLKVSGKKKK